jgi:RNA polymerase sigma factor (sigma-70 family)
MKEKIDEETLIKMLYGRNPSAPGILYDRYSAALYGIIFRILQDHVLAEITLQESFSKIWNDFQQYDASKGRLLTWMINISRNLSLEKLRSKDFYGLNKNLSAESYVSMLNSKNGYSFNPESIQPEEIVHKLEPEYKMIIDLLFFHGLTQSEAAEKLNIPLGTVKSRSHAAVQKLKEIFQDR